MQTRNVLRVNASDEQRNYREAVAEILRCVQSDHSVTLLEISERVDISLGTVSNAANKKTDLSPTFLQRLGRAYGVHHLDPYVRLMGGRIIPIEHSTERDVLPFINRAALKIAEARDPQSPGGVREIHTEKLDYLPDLLALQKELSGLICSIQAEAA
jgi:hypothetical protein